MDPITIALGLAQFAPSLLRYFGVGEKPAAVAEKVIDIAKGITGAGDAAGALEVMRKDAALAQQFNLAVLAADTELEKAYLAGVADARARDIEVRKIDGGHNKRADIMVVCDFLGLIACLVVLCIYYKELPGEATALISTIASIFGLNLRDAHQFEFGSSRGSKEARDALIAKS